MRALGARASVRQAVVRSRPPPPGVRAVTAAGGEIEPHVFETDGLLPGGSSACDRAVSHRHDLENQHPPSLASTTSSGMTARFQKPRGEQEAHARPRPSRLTPAARLSSALPNALRLPTSGVAPILRNS